MATTERKEPSLGDWKAAMAQPNFTDPSHSPEDLLQTQSQVRDVLLGLNEVNDLQLKSATDLVQRLKTNGGNASPEDVQQAMRTLTQTLTLARDLAAALSEQSLSQRDLLEGVRAVVDGQPEQAPAAWARSAESMQRVKDRLIDIGFGMSQWPQQAWEGLTGKVRSTVGSSLVVEALSNRLDRIENWFGQRVQAVGRFAERIEAAGHAMVQAIEDRVNDVYDRAVDAKDRLKSRIMGVALSALEWGVEREVAMRAKVREVSDRVADTLAPAAAVGDALAHTAQEGARALGDTLSSLRKGFRERLDQARQERGIQDKNDGSGRPKP